MQVEVIVRIDRRDVKTMGKTGVGWAEARQQQYHQIGTGMSEAAAKQLVAMRLKGPGMDWS